MSTTITKPFKGTATQGHLTEDVVLRLTYDTDDPYALQGRFTTATGSTDWMFSRELLEEAFIACEAGSGDVNFYVGTSTLVISIFPQNETPSLIRLSRDGVGGFLRRLEEILPFRSIKIPEQAIDEFLREVLG